MNKDVQKWADKAMYTAEGIEFEPLLGVEADVALLQANHDPLGSIAAAAMAYEGKFVASLEEISDDERRHYLGEMQKTALAMPLEAVQFHFRVKGVSRGFTHQMVRQRTAAYSQESMRFAVKEDMPVVLPPSIKGVISELEGIKADIRNRFPKFGNSTRPISREWQDKLSDEGIKVPAELVRDCIAFDTALDEWNFRQARASNQAKIRGIWDKLMEHIFRAYTQMIDLGMPAEEARGCMPTNIATQINYVTNLRNLQAEAGKRLCTQAQFDWRDFWAKVCEDMIRYGETRSYRHSLNSREAKLLDYYPGDSVVSNSKWQFEEIAKLFKPVCYQKGHCVFLADFDRHCSIRDRVQLNASANRPSSEWDKDHNVVVNPLRGEVTYIGIPAIHTSEWMLDPKAARKSQ